MLCLLGLAILAADSGEWSWAVRIFTAAEATRVTTGLALDSQDISRRDHYLAVARATLGEHTFEQAREEGVAHRLDILLEKPLD